MNPQQVLKKAIADAERTKWVDTLRQQLRVFNVVPPALVEEHQFLEDRRFRFDFALPGLKVGVEVEGGVFAPQTSAELAYVDGKVSKVNAKRSRHVTGVGYQRDCEKYNLAALAGWIVLRFTSPMITSGAAVRMIVDAIKVRTRDAQ
jgi:very-short-patch-repair endonuclease